ncbi:hypothetical protein VB264_16550 [Arcicella aquatica]|uniref:TonB C-terminal domain-containing protein n=1 Tax=Arcicella aquatica TaxID=217141 RepID=A0ABU5QQR0_9BACT|nr:hypothetical protein [Arcicella aquatica]MEA5259411.1 hypothetical protein [Arcicella aquatica]
MPTMHQKHIAHKGSLLIFFLLISFNIILGQSSSSNDTPPKLQMKDRKNIWSKLRIPTFNPDTICTISVFSFKVTAQGTIDTVFVKGACPEKVKDAVVNHIKSTSGYWAPRMVAGKPVESKLFILPYLLEGTFGVNEVGRKLLERVSHEFVDFMELLFDNQKVDYGRNRTKGGKLFIETETSYLLPYGVSFTRR